MRFLLLTLVFVLCAAPASAQDGYTPSPENLEAREWFREAKFGLFVHWGVYSTLARGEWVMQVQSLPISTYEKLPDFFDPYAFDAREWVQLVKDAGMRYITITAKHHDGFAMYDSAVSDWDIVDRTRFGRDPLAELAEACREAGIKLFFYYSQLDWNHPDYYPRGGTGRETGREDEGDWDAYIDYMNAQLTELLTNYGDIGGLWFDGMWDKPDADWRMDETYSLIHRLQPAAMIGSNHHIDPFPGEDFQMFEKDLPGGSSNSWSGTAEISSLPLETAETINGAWGYNIYDRNLKSREDLIRYLVKAAGHDANFLLNVGPMPDGRIQDDFQERLREMGSWLSENGESIYGTRKGPVEPGDWGVSTYKDGQVFLHVLDWDQNALALSWPDDLEVGAAKLHRTGEYVPFEKIGGAIVVQLPERPQGLLDEIVVLEVDE